MSTDHGSPEDTNVIAEAIDSRLLNIWIAGPGIVQSWDGTKQSVTVQPAVRRPIPTTEGENVQETPPPVQNVPFVWIGSQGFSMQHIPQKGDVVLLVYLDFSPALFRSREDVSDTPDVRKHSPSYPVAIPWFFGTIEDSPHPSVGIPGGLRIIFKTDVVEVGGGQDFVAMASKTNDRLDALETHAASHTHASVTSLGTPTTGVPPFSAGGGPVDSSNLKASP